MSNIKPYIEQTLQYTSDGRLLDELGNAVMMDWERPIMKKSAEIVCRNKGKILNIGFGMGIIDTFIQENEIQEHWIIEPHRDVYTKMFEDGWHLKPNVKIFYGDWQWYLKFLPQFDGVFFDTWNESEVDFLKNVHLILNNKGIFSFFNNPRNDEKGLHILEENFEIISKWGSLEFECVELEFIERPNKQRTDGKLYWSTDWKKYYCPIIQKKQFNEIRYQF